MELKLDLSELKTYAGHESEIVEFVPKWNNTNQTKSKEKIESGHCGNEDAPKPHGPLHETILQLAETMNEMKIWMRKVAVNDGPMTREEAAEYLKVNKDTLYRWAVEEGKIAYSRLGTGGRAVLRFRKKDLDDFVSKMRIPTVEEVRMKM